MTRQDAQRLLAVNEIFGPTVQGEGPSIGRPCMFLRLGGCSVQCEWCDTKYSWDTQDPGYNVRMMSQGEVTATFASLTPTLPDMLVISGGEPMQQAGALHEILPRLAGTFSRIEIETSGIIPPLDKAPNVFYNVSPKLKHANTKRPYDLDVLDLFTMCEAKFKFVVQDVSDFNEVDLIVEYCNLRPQDVYIMPLGIGRHELMERTQKVVDAVVARRYNLTTRLHILIWGNRRGV
jgi:7-carboxy-7-deazaguanine synthase